MLKSLLHDAEILTGHYDDRPITFFNVLRRVDRQDMFQLDSDAVFRVNPVGLHIVCFDGFKNAVERSGLKGLAFRKVDLEDRYGLV